MHGTIRRGGPVLAALAALTAITTIALDAAHSQTRPGTRDCSLTTINATALSDLGTAEYAAGHIGGLYPGGQSTRPEAHELAGLEIGHNYVVPRDRSGVPSPQNGRIGLISVGMSNTALEFGANRDSFMTKMALDPSRSPHLVIINGAQGGKSAAKWADPSDTAWSELDQRVAADGLSSEQVQVAWIKLAEPGPAALGAFPLHAEILSAHLESVVRILRARFPNLRLAYLSSRTRAYTDDPATLNPEPFAYESGFAVRWLIEKQLDGDLALDFSPDGGAAPWLSWGPYLWADGEVARSDGMTWICNDTGPDLTHPSGSGIAKVADQLIAFFKTDPTATPWFLRNAAIGQPPTVAARADVTAGQPPLTVQFTADAADADGAVQQYVWTFDDGTYAVEQNPIKTFPAPGLYDVPLTVTDNDGNTVTAQITINVGGGGGQPPALAITAPESPLPTGFIGQPYSAQFTASTDGQVNWSVVGGRPPQGLSLNRHGVYSGTPTRAGVFGFTVQASTAEGTVSAQFVHTVQQGAQTVMLSPVADAYVRDGSFANANFGFTDRLVVRASDGGRHSRAYLKFDLANVAGPCTSAKLKVLLSAKNGSQALPVDVFSVEDDSWAEDSITWNTRRAEVARLASAALDSAGVVASFDVTDYVAAQVAGDRLVSLTMLDATGSGVAGAFDSREATTKPQLELVCN